MLAISERVIRQFQIERTDRLALRIFGLMPTMGSFDVARGYVQEALTVGLETDRDIAEFALLVHPVDQAGRRQEIQSLVNEPATTGTLKLFQISYALNGERQ